MSPTPTIVPEMSSKEMTSSVAEQRSSSSEARPMLPLVVSLKGRIGSSVIPSLDEIFTKCCQSPHAILNLEAADSVETSVAEYIQGRAERTLQKEASSFSIVMSRNHSGMKSDLERSKLNYSYDPPTPLAASVAESTEPKQLRVYENLQDAIRDVRYEYQSNSCVLPDKLCLSLTTLCEAILHQYITTSKQQSILPEHRSARMMVRNLECGETIACFKYPLLPAFIVLNGRVAIRELHATAVDSASRKCIREAVPSIMKAVFCREVTVKDEQYPEIVEGSLHGNGPQVVAPRSPFCARVDSKSCSILDIDPTYNQYWGNIIERVRQSRAPDDMN